ncbi:protein FAR-RED IMPAIRED RESPONSE 1-like [Arachis ipaensis]|uniref:protein FAR-RED IMPAIRED RESPONSE 1-like n=1 Tax=Arachis ipaensis TaxID=130454 RepID=UPI0007AF9C06|nr:protein FAR-RED IMPAIRED RESPONSE 1-like [Arachis ipaensis]XP_025638539.1 protein FAR-RED IMPAIRED RESPONSE 1-like [Arachis hypogaea]
MFWKFSLDEERRLHNIFWCDGTSRHDYSVFGDVLGFDATYGRNRYKCPLVIFSGLDHHMRTVVFGCAILSNEVEKSYVWLLRAFLEAMKGQEPKSVLTDGDLTMKNAINAVFPNAHHRLCSWHLLQNATARIGRPMFLRKFRVCLMGDLEVDEFENLWSDIVEEFGLQQNPWILDMYERKHMWANAYIRGKFFAGLKTTSRCEALNMQIGKFIGNGYNLHEFIEHFQHYLEFMRRRELVADYRSVYGQPIFKSKLEALESYAAIVYTKDVFELFREVLLLSSNVRVVSCKKTSTCSLFEVTMYCRDRSWSVAWDKADDEFTCSCLRMESFGIPCVHMVGVFVYLNITQLPVKTICERWTKKAKQAAVDPSGQVGEIPDAAYMSMHAALLNDCRELIKLACQYFEDYSELKSMIRNQSNVLREKHRLRVSIADCGEKVSVRDPLRARHKGCGQRGLTAREKTRRVQRCSKCGKASHNSRKCAEFGSERRRGMATAMEGWENTSAAKEGNYTDEMNVSGIYILQESYLNLCVAYFGMT